MKIKFVENCTVFPDDKEIDARVGQELDVADEAYAQLLIDKGHAVAAEKPVAAKKEKA